MIESPWSKVRGGEVLWFCCVLTYVSCPKTYTLCRGRPFLFFQTITSYIAVTIDSAPPPLVEKSPQQMTFRGYLPSTITIKVHQSRCLRRLHGASIIPRLMPFSLLTYIMFLLGLAVLTFSPAMDNDSEYQAAFNAGGVFADWVNLAGMRCKSFQ